MKFKVGDKVTIENSDNFFVQDFKDKPGIIVAVLDCPYQVKFKTGRRWCKESELKEIK